MSRGGHLSHPPSLLRIVERTLREECSLVAGDRVLLAVSGGGDSTAMLHVLSRLAPRLGVGLFAHGVDHGLRAEAGTELDLASTLAERLGIEFSRCQIEVARGSNLQARAREARYVALRHRADELGCTLIATAHHADDRAETVFMRLLRGSGIQGLGVLAPRENHLLRPLIRARRSDISAHLSRHELLFSSDPSNDNTHYLRVTVRKVLLPSLVEVSPGIVSHLCAIADEVCAMRRETDELDPGSPTQDALGRRQRTALTRAIARRQFGFELPLEAEMLLRLVRDERR